MAKKQQPKNQSTPNLEEVIKQKSIGIVTAEWHQSITYALESACVDHLQQSGIQEDRLQVKRVPGSFEVPLGAQYLAELGNVHGVVCIGCLIQGQTPHFHYIADAVTRNIADLNLKYSIPFIYGMLTVNKDEQAEERAGGKQGNKGIEAADAVLKMLQLKQEFLTGKHQLGY